MSTLTHDQNVQLYLERMVTDLTHARGASPSADQCEPLRRWAELVVMAPTEALGHSFMHEGYAEFYRRLDDMETAHEKV